MDKSMLLASLLDEMPEVAPLDDHNRVLVSHVHPTDWQNRASRRLRGGLGPVDTYDTDRRMRPPAPHVPSRVAR